MNDTFLSNLAKKKQRVWLHLEHIKSGRRPHTDPKGRPFDTNLRNKLLARNFFQSRLNCQYILILRGQPNLLENNSIKCQKTLQKLALRALNLAIIGSLQRCGRPQKT